MWQEIETKAGGNQGTLLDEQKGWSKPATIQESDKSHNHTLLTTNQSTVKKTKKKPRKLEQTTY